MFTTLVTKVTLHTSKASQTYIQDCPAHIEKRGDFYYLEFTGPDRAVTVQLNGAERIAMKEMLEAAA